jgi:hypothetical protein
MPKVSYEHLEQVRKALKSSNKELNAQLEPSSHQGNGVGRNTELRSAISKNEKAIEMLDEEYLDIKQ